MALKVDSMLGADVQSHLIQCQELKPQENSVLPPPVFLMEHPALLYGHDLEPLFQFIIKSGFRI